MFISCDCVGKAGAVKHDYTDPTMAPDFSSIFYFILQIFILICPLAGLWADNLYFNEIIEFSACVK